MHRALISARRWFGQLSRPAVAGIVAALIVIPGAGAVVIAASNGPDQVVCAPGVELIVHPDGTWSCGQPTGVAGATASPGANSADPTVSPTNSGASTSPAASANSTPPQTTTSTRSTPPSGTGCVSNPSKCGYPDATNTGARGTLAVVQGDVTLKTAGQVYSDKEVRGCIKVTAANVVIRNVRVTGSCEYNIDVELSTSGTSTIEDTTIVCGDPTGTGIGEFQFVARRVDVSRCANGFDVDRDAVIVDSICHDLTPEEGAGSVSGVHTDCVQGDMTKDVTIDHNSLLAPYYATSAIIAAATNGSVRYRWVVRNNLLDGGGYTVYCLRNGTEVDSMVTGNRFGPGGWNHSYADDCNDGGLIWSGNYRDATLAALPAT